MMGLGMGAQLGRTAAGVVAARSSASTSMSTATPSNRLRIRRIGLYTNSTSLVGFGGDGIIIQGWKQLLLFLSTNRRHFHNCRHVRICGLASGTSSRGSGGGNPSSSSSSSSSSRSSIVWERASHQTWIPTTAARRIPIRGVHFTKAPFVTDRTRTVLLRRAWNLISPQTTTTPATATTKPNHGWVVASAALAAGMSAVGASSVAWTNNNNSNCESNKASHGDAIHEITIEGSNETSVKQQINQSQQQKQQPIKKKKNNSNVHQSHGGNDSSSSNGSQQHKSENSNGLLPLPPPMSAAAVVFPFYEYLLKQLQVVVYVEDRDSETIQSDSGRSKPTGLVGLACLHCIRAGINSDDETDQSQQLQSLGPDASIFPQDRRSLARDVSTNMYHHLTNCENCPSSTKHKLRELQREQQQLHQTKQQQRQQDKSVRATETKKTVVSREERLFFRDLWFQMGHKDMAEGLGGKQQRQQRHQKQYINSTDEVQ